MDLLVIILTAIGLAMDATAVSIVKGITVTKDRKRSAILLASLFGGFQALMPLIGWFAGVGLKDTIAGVDHWIAFGLLGAIGAKMIYDSLDGEDGDGESVTLHAAIVLAIATSIDALMVGFSFALLDVSVYVPIVVIGAVTFILSLMGFVFGTRLGRTFGNRFKLLGGIILILIGIKILLEHL